MKLIFAIFLSLALFSQAALAETSGTINNSNNSIRNITSVTGLLGYTVDFCSVDANCNGYKCFSDFDGTSSGSSSGWCNQTSVTKCYHDNAGYAAGTYYCRTNTTYHICDAGGAGSWGASASCPSGQTCTVDSTSTSSPCSTPSSPTTTSGGSSSSSTAANASKVVLKITGVPAEMSIVQGSSGNITIDVKNDGNTVTQNVTLSVSGISWATVTPSIHSVLSAGNSRAFNITISVPGDAEIKAYTVTLSAASTNATASSDFPLKVLPSTASSLGINQTYINYISILSELSANLTELEKQGATKSDVGSIKNILDSARGKVDQANQSIAGNDYFTANSLLADAASLIDDARNKIKNIGFGEPSTPIDTTFIFVIIGVVTAVVVVVLYLFWPTKQQKSFVTFKKTK